MQQNEIGYKVDTLLMHSLDIPEIFIENSFRLLERYRQIRFYSYLEIGAKGFKVDLNSCLSIDGKIKITKHRPRERKVTSGV